MRETVDDHCARMLMTPIHDMALMAPQTTAADVDRHWAVLRSAAQVPTAEGG